MDIKTVKIVRMILIVVFAIVCTVVFVNIRNRNNNFMKIEPNNSMIVDNQKKNISIDEINTKKTGSEKIETLDLKINIALFGLDTRKNDYVGRSDAIIVISYDSILREVKLLSFMRDLRVKIEGHSYSKLGHAFAYGKEELALKTINENFGLNIENYITVNFFTLSKIIDAVDGILIDVQQNEIKQINDMVKAIKNPNDIGTIKDIINPGMQLLNGDQAVAFSRIRKVGNGDFERTERQRKVISTLMLKIISLDNIQKLESANDIFSFLRTNIEINDLAETIIHGDHNGENIRILEKRFPLKGDFVEDMSSGIYYLKPTDYEKMKIDVKNFISETAEIDNK